VKAIGRNLESENSIEAIAMHINVLEHLPEIDLESNSYHHWRKEQHDDPVIRTVMKKMTIGRDIVDTKSDNPEVRLFLKEHKKLFFKRGVLYRRREENGEEVHQLVLPVRCRSLAMKGLHEDVGHPGVDRTLSLLRERFYWPLMEKDVREKVNSCSRCILRKSRGQTAPLVNITSTQPMELLCIDFLTIEPSKGGIENVLVITDHFTRYAQAFPTANQNARTTAKVLFDNFIVHYGFPARIHSDQGRNFEGEIITQLCAIAGIEKSRTTPYHPMGNGMVERFNRTLLGMLGTLSTDQKADWKSFVRPLVHAYNSTKHESTGFSPFYLMFGRQPRLAIDVTMGLPEDQDKKESYTKFISKLKDRLEYSYKLAFKNAERSSDKQKKFYDRTIRNISLEKGDHVLVKKTAFQGKHKLANKWEDETYTVESQPNPDIPVYVVRRESDGTKKTLHRNLLLPVTSTFDKSSPKEKKPVKFRRNRRVAKPSEMLKTISSEEGERSDSEEDEESSDEMQVHYRRQEEQPVQDEESEEMHEDHEPEVSVEGGSSGDETQDNIPLHEETDDDGGGDIGGEEVQEVEQEDCRTQEDDSEDLRLMPRRSKRTSRPPQRYEDFVMQHSVSSPKKRFNTSHTAQHAHTKPVPTPRHTTSTNCKDKMQRPIPTPRHRKEVLDSSDSDLKRSQILEVFMGMQQSQQRMQDAMLNVLIGSGF